MDAPASRADAARRNGALSQGPVTPDGKARSARNAVRHGVCSKSPTSLDAEDAAALAALRGALIARHLPRDEAEAHWVEELAFAAWRQRRLRGLESEILARAMASAGPDREPSAALPSLSTLIRYRARLDRDWRRATEELDALRRSRSVEPTPTQLRLVADLIEQGAAAGQTPPEKCTNEPDARPMTDESSSGADTNEPTAAAHRTNGTWRGTDGPRHAVPPLPVMRTDEPEDRPAPPALNRHERRRLAALARRGLRPAA
jgi:hypothetical protein